MVSKIFKEKSKFKSISINACVLYRNEVLREVVQCLDVDDMAIMSTKEAVQNPTSALQDYLALPS